MIDSLYYSSRTIPGQFENSFVDYKKKNYEKLFLFNEANHDSNELTQWVSSYLS